MLRTLLTIVALMIWTISVLQGEEIWLEQVGEAITNKTDTMPQYPTPLTWKDFYEIRPPITGAPNLNAITKEPLSNSYTHFAVGDQGKVFKIDGFHGVLQDSAVLLNGAYNLTGVSFAPNTDTGWIVGYKRDNWQGVILKTVDTGRTWIQQTYDPFPGNIPVPFLDVWVVNGRYVWISCAHGYVLRTRNSGQNWYRTPAKPGSDTHYGWLWGVWAYDTATAWVCSDQSGLVAKTTNSGAIWSTFCPGEQITPQDTFLSFRDVTPKPTGGIPDPTKIELAASNGKVVYTTDNGATWSYYLTFNTDKQWFSGLFDEREYSYDFSYVCGSGGTIGRGPEGTYPGPLWYSKQYDLNDIGGKGWTSANYLVAIGTNSAIIGSNEISGLVENQFYIWGINASSGNEILLTWRVTNTFAYEREARCKVWYSLVHEEDYDSTHPTARFYTPFQNVYTQTVPANTTVEFEVWYNCPYQGPWWFLVTFEGERHYTSPGVDSAYDMNAQVTPMAGEPYAFTISDPFWDNGWNARLNWSCPGSYHNFTICTPPRSYKGGLIAVVPEPPFDYDNLLIGYPATYWIRTLFQLYFSDSVTAIGTSIDEAPPPKVTGLSGYYNSILDAVVLQWNPISPNDEPNLGGYWVCPETIGGIDHNINHPCPLYRNYYIEKVPEWARGHYWGFWVCAMDRSGNWGDWSDSVLIWIDTLKFRFTDSPFATAFNQGRHLDRFNETGMLHMVYETKGKVLYCTSNDNGENWTEADIGNGCFPSIALDHEGNPWIAYWKDGDIVCQVQRTKDSWKEIVVYDGNETTTWAGAPSIALGTIPDGVNAEQFAYITYTVYEGDSMPEMPSSPPYSISYSYIKLSILDTINIAHYTVDEGDGETQVGFPSIDMIPADYIHLVWQKEDEIWYITNSGNINYDNWQNVQLEEIFNISESPEVSSQHPFAEAYGDNVFVAWKEGEPGEIYRRTKNLPFNYWNNPENISQSPEDASDYPVLATSDVVAYQEKIGANNSEIYTWILGDIYNLSETSKPSKYPNIVVEPPLPQQPEILVDAIWTEEITPDTLYEVKFKRHVHPINPEGMGMGAYLSVTTGDSVASPYCEQRDGFVHYGQYSLDYANSSLIYNLPYLHPKSNYLLKAKVYHALTGRWREKMFADSILGADVYFDPNVPTSVNIILPKESYANDFEIRKEIQRLVGRYAVITDFKIYEVSLPDSGGGGGQNAGITRILKTILYQNSPNPFNIMTEISFGLAKESNVSFSIFDATGRMVRRLINDKLKPGIYNLRWDGKDDEMRNLAQGVYFYRLKTENYIATKKMTLLK